jgi:lipopolysaccharide/colanic/teichoic acid biosynthesis glycosyltransferase
MVDIAESNPLSRYAQYQVLINDFIKRAFDIAVSAIVLVLFAPIFGLIALTIKHDSPGPVIYRGPRLGLRRQRFNILKFRTMEETPQSYSGPKITAHDDPRITPVGRWLRDTKLNEFPQFWNVLKGEMSLVGPRPEDPGIARTWPKRVMDEVLSVRPGITSPATIHYHNEERLLSVRDVEQKYIHELSPNKMRLDQLYVHHHSFLLDLDVILWTVVVLLPKLGSYKPPEELLFVGFITRFINRFFNWFTIDLITTMIAFGCNLLIYRAIAPLNVGILNALGLIIGFAFLFSVTGVILGTNRVRWARAKPADSFDLLPSWILATTIAFLVNIWKGFFPSNYILISSGLALLGFVTIRYRNLIFTGLYNRLMQLQKNNQTIRERVLIIGLGASAQHTTWLLEHLMNSRMFFIVGFVDNDITKQGMRFYGANVLGKWEDIPRLVEKYDVGIVIMADYRIDSRELRTIKNICSTTSSRLVVMPDVLVSINQLATSFSRISQKKLLDRGLINSACLDCLAKSESSNKNHYWKNWEKQVEPFGLSNIRSQVLAKRMSNYKHREGI